MSTSLPTQYQELRDLLDFVVDEPYFNDQFERYLFLLSCIHPHLTSLDSPAVLDAGIFPGHLALAVRKIYNATIDGIQFKPEPEFDDRARDLGIRVHVLNAEREKFPFPDDRFDLVVATEILEHFYFPQSFLSELFRVLKPDGVCLISTPNQASFYNRFQLMFRGHSVFGHLFGIDRVFEETEWVHKREYTGDEVARLFRAVGFRRIQIRYCHPRQLGRNSRSPLRWMKDLLLTYPPFRSDLVVLARKE